MVIGMAEEHKFVSLPEYEEFTEDEMIAKSASFYQSIKIRRTVRDFSDRSVPFKIIENCIRAGGTAPSGANLQPWHFVVVQDEQIKKTIRVHAQKEEKEFYEQKAPQEWLSALAPLGTDASKPFLTRAPYLIIVFSKSYDITENGEKVKNYYVKESVGIACGFLLAALHNSGLVTLTHTPSPMTFLNKICKRPKNEKPYMIIVAGYPEEDAQVPVHGMIKKDMSEIMTRF